MWFFLCWKMVTTCTYVLTFPLHWCSLSTTPQGAGCYRYSLARYRHSLAIGIVLREHRWATNLFPFSLGCSSCLTFHIVSESPYQHLPQKDKLGFALRLLRIYKSNLGKSKSVILSFSTLEFCMPLHLFQSLNSLIVFYNFLHTEKKKSNKKFPKRARNLDQRLICPWKDQGVCTTPGEVFDLSDECHFRQDTHKSIGEGHARVLGRADVTLDRIAGTGMLC
jgi:hypothetical protein